MEAKGEGKYDDDDAPKGSGGGGGGGSKEAKAEMDENELLMMVASDAERDLFGEHSALMRFVSDHAEEWIEAVDGERDGSGSPIKAMGRYRNLHGGSDLSS